MKVISNSDSMQKLMLQTKLLKKTIGFVPTMGALHEGHLSLMKKARKENDIVVVSIFVNPTQFGPKEDLKKYPRPWKQDKKLCEDLNIDYIFKPDAKRFYETPYLTSVKVEKITNILCGKSRPNHFRGVTTVVTKLFNIVQPDKAYFGQKDYQQSQVIRTMVRNLNMPVRIKVMPIIREKDGLALSSRNQYLSEEERSRALNLYSTLLYGKKLYSEGLTNPKNLHLRMYRFLQRSINKRKDKIDYLEIRNAQTLGIAKEHHTKIVIALAVFIGKTRLIDNILLG